MTQAVDPQTEREKVESWRLHVLIEAGYRRFVERRLREEFGFDGSPVQVSVRVRAKREGTGRRPARAGNRR